MRMLVSAFAMAGALALGAVPALALTGDAADQGVQSAGQGPDKPVDKNLDGKPGYGPPAHAGSRHGEEMSALGRAHGKAMRAWAACVSEACGEKPTPPGHLKHLKHLKHPAKKHVAKQR